MSKYHGYLDSVNRGRLTEPNDSVVHFVYFMYVAFTALCKNDAVPCFSAVHLLCERINASYQLIPEQAESAVFSTMCNILLNNFTRNVSTAYSSKAPLIKVAKLGD